ncbi:MAG TPA: Fur family transcriptional regulator [Planctomycetaceae bacterium]|nr:Fur family transcriptional regulator [Planctomycetaceae bacterium]
MTELSAIETAVSPADRFREFLATRGERLTPQRATVVDEVFSSHDHFDAEQLVLRLSARHVSRPSVYRTLGLLVEAGLLRKVVRINNREVYEHDYGYPQHDHLICKKCGELIEFNHPDLSRILEEITRQYGFRMESHRLEVHGLCDNCSRPRRRTPSKLDMI